MPDPKAIVNYGVKFRVGASTEATEATVLLGGCEAVNPPSEQRDSIDCTSQDSDRFRDFIMGPFSTVDDLKVDMNWVPGTDTTELLEVLMAETIPRRYTQTWTQVTPNIVVSFLAFLMAKEASGDLDGKMTGTGTWKITGPITIGVAA